MAESFALLKAVLNFKPLSMGISPTYLLRWSTSAYTVSIDAPALSRSETCTRSSTSLAATSVSVSYCNVAAERSI